jgi:hypothetical protein
LHRKDAVKTIVKLLACGMLLFATQAEAAQQLLPAPYPGQLGGNAQESQPSSGVESPHQALVPQPVPQTYGPAAQDNPATMQPSAHQHITPDPYRRNTWCNGANNCSTLR